MAIVYYRLPRQADFIRIECEDENVECVSSCVELKGKSGFVFAPFKCDDAHPIIIMRDYSWRTQSVKSTTPYYIKEELTKSYEKIEAERQQYACDFSKCKHEIDEKHFSKVVLARYDDVNYRSELDMEATFMNACKRYPRMFVAMISTEITGTWLMATPELLMSETGGVGHTMALAGTMNLSAKQYGFDNPLGSGLDHRIVWSEKNKNEQRIVADYIKKRLLDVSDSVTESDVYTSRAGNLVHLRSDFSYNAGSNQSALIDALFPTPAVCGMPKEETREFILDNETIDREYYSGFAGLLNVDGSSQLFVTLRCMKLLAKNRVRLFAGGGIMPDSVETDEWHETENKMETIKTCIATKKM